MARGSQKIDLRIHQVAAPADPPKRASGAPSVGGPISFVSFAQPQTEETGNVVPLSEFGGPRIDLKEFMRGIAALVGDLRPLITDDKRNTRDKEILKRVRGGVRSSSTGGGASRGNRADGTDPVSTKSFPQRVRRADEEAQQARLQAQEPRRACENLRADLDSVWAWSWHIEHHSYDDSTGGFTPSNCGGPHPYRGRNCDGYNDGGGFAA